MKQIFSKTTNNENLHFDFNYKTRSVNFPFLNGKIHNHIRNDKENQRYNISNIRSKIPSIFLNSNNDEEEIKIYSFPIDNKETYRLDSIYKNENINQGFSSLIKTFDIENNRNLKPCYSDISHINSDVSDKNDGMLK